MLHPMRHRLPALLIALASACQCEPPEIAPVDDGNDPVGEGEGET